MIEGHLKEFFGKKVKVYEKDAAVSGDFAYRICTDWDLEEDFIEKLSSFLSSPKINEIEALIIGAWELECDGDSQELVKLLIDSKDKLPNLKALMIGDIEGEEQEISWIEQSDLGGLLKTYQQLEIFRARGGQYLRISEINHSSIKKLIIETGGMSAKVLQDLSNATLPQLEHLELWLGEEDYGFDASAEEIAAVIKNFENQPLKYLGLRNSEIADKLPALVLNSPIMNSLDELDFSLGTLGDLGAKVLLDSSAILNLKKLSLQHHYISSVLMQQFKNLPIEVDVSDQEEDDIYDGEVYRYISVGE